MKKMSMMIILNIQYEFLYKKESMEIGIKIDLMWCWASLHGVHFLHWVGKNVNSCYQLTNVEWKRRKFMHHKMSNAWRFVFSLLSLFIYRIYPSLDNWIYVSGRFLYAVLTLLLKCSISPHHNHNSQFTVLLFCL